MRAEESRGGSWRVGLMVLAALVASVIIASIGAGVGTSAVPCTISFDGGGGDSFWDTPQNWSTDVLPGPADHACIGSSFAVLFRGGGSILTVQVDGSLTVNGGTFSLTDTANDSRTARTSLLSEDCAR